MVLRRRIEFAYLLGSLLLLPASLHAPTAYAAPGDPPSGSPAGAVYQLPLEQGRSDAAPKGGGGETGGGASGGGTGGSGSLYRSENNFGSSSHVPGVAGTGGGSSGGGSGAGAAGGGSAAPGGTIAAGTVAAETADTGNTSVPAAVVLIGGIGLLAVAIGVLSRRFRASRPS